MSVFFTTKEIAAALGVTEQAIRKRAHDWERTKKSAGKGFLYPLEGLPTEIQQKISHIYKDSNDETEPSSIDVLADPVPISEVEASEPIVVDNVGAGELPAAISPEILQTASDAPVLDVVHGDSPKNDGKKRKRPREENPAKAAAWQAILAGQDIWSREAGNLLRVACDEAFAVAYNKQAIVGISPEIYELIPKISRATIARKRQSQAINEKSGRPKS